MRKVLLTTTAFVAFAGAAAAQTQLVGKDGRQGTIEISGNAEMGVAGFFQNMDFSTNGRRDAGSDLPTQFWQQLDLDFELSGTTDGGLTFGASVDADEFDNLGANFDDGGFTVFIKGNFGEVTMGDTDGALDWALTEANFGPDSMDDAHTVHLGYNGAYLDGKGHGDGQIVRYNYSFSNFGVAVSVEQMPDKCTGGGGAANRNNCGGGTASVVDDLDRPGVNLGGTTTAPTKDDGLGWAIAGKGSFDINGGKINAGIGYQFLPDLHSIFAASNGSAPIVNIGGLAGGVGGVFLDPSLTRKNVTIGGRNAGGLLDNNEFFVGDTTAVGVSAGIELDSGIKAGFQYTSYSFENIDESMTHIGVGAGYSFDAISVGANYGQYRIEDYAVTGFGLSAQYDLGGGAAIAFGYGSSSTDDFDFDGDARGDSYTSKQYSLGLIFNF